ncbi:MAG: TonB-dependent receptor [Gemmatimonadales bacterium]|nr:TonB-dependent receptor [Gemmatimonadales bacterium]
MRRTAGFCACAALALFVPLRTLAAQSGGIRGRVADAGGAPLARATVSVDGTPLRASSNDQGGYLISGVPAGTHTVRARALGYVAQSAQVTVAGGQTTTRDFTLQPQPISLSAIDVTIGSRARHTAAEELAVPVDVYDVQDIASQGTRETSQILQALSPSVNFPRQSVTDGTDIVRPFTLRGLSPDHTLVLVNGWRRHQTALVNTFAYGTGAGSSGVDLNAIPASAIERIEVLRDGASAQYGSDAIAGVVNIVTREGVFSPFVSLDAGQHFSADYPNDGRTLNVNGGWGFGLGRGSLALFAEVLDRQPTNRAGADLFDDPLVPQPNQHWGDGLERDLMTMANLRMPLNDDRTSEIYAFGGYSFRSGTGNGYRRYAGSDRNWPQIYPLGFLPEFNPDVTDFSLAGGYRGAMQGWSVDAGASLGHNAFEYNLRNTLNASLGPCVAPAAPCAPGSDGILGNADDPGIPNQTSFFAGQLRREEFAAGINAAKPLSLGLAAPVNVAVGATLRRERYRITQGELASWVDGGDTTQSGGEASAGSQVFPGFAPGDEADASRTNFGAYADLESDLTPEFLANLAARFESYSDFGSVVTGKLAFRYRPSPELTFRAASSTGFRAPGLGQINFSKVITNVIAGSIEEIGVFPVGNAAARALGSKPLREESSVNLSAGFAFSPDPNLTFTADYFRITINDRIILGATFDDDTTLAILAAGGFNNIAGVQYFTNGLDTRTQGVDLTGNLRVPALTGTLNLTGAVNFTRNEITRVDPLPAVLQNSAEPGLLDTVTVLAIEEERPDWRATVTAQYSTGRLQALVRGSYFGGFSSAQPGYCDRCRETYGAKTLFDAEVGYRFGLMNLAVGVRNLFDTYPDQPSSLTPTDPNDPTSDPAKLYNNNYGTFPWAAASPFGYNGRYLYARVDMRMR